jgi:hypothetical protein
LSEADFCWEDAFTFELRVITGVPEIVYHNIKGKSIAELAFPRAQ